MILIENEMTSSNNFSLMFYEIIYCEQNSQTSCYYYYFVYIWHKLGLKWVLHWRLCLYLYFFVGSTPAPHLPPSRPPESADFHFFFTSNANRCSTMLTLSSDLVNKSHTNLLMTSVNSWSHKLCKFKCTLKNIWSIL